MAKIRNFSMKSTYIINGETIELEFGIKRRKVVILNQLELSDPIAKEFIEQVVKDLQNQLDPLL